MYVWETNEATAKRFEKKTCRTTVKRTDSLATVLQLMMFRGLKYRSADKSLALPTSRCILFDGENISFDSSLVIYINSTNIPPNMIINRIYEHQNLLSL